MVATDRRSTTRLLHASELFQTRVDDRFWGFGGRTRNRNRLRRGDHAIIYLGGSAGKKAVADCTVASDPFELSREDKVRFAHNEAAFFSDYGVYLQSINLWPRAVTFIPSLIQQLSFIKNKNQWGTALQGTLIGIPQADYRTILRYRSDKMHRAQLNIPLISPKAEVVAHGKPLSLLLGNDLLSGENVRWSPMEEKNPHLLIVGMSGSGKTETLKSMIFELGRAGIPSAILDLHNEFQAVADKTIDLSATIKLNPLEILGRSPLSIVYEVSSILRSIYRLGDQQEAVLRNALKQSYRKHEITSERSTWKHAPPTFGEMHEILENMKEDKQIRAFVTRLLNRIEPLFDMEVFAEETYFPFGDVVKQITALQLVTLPSEPVKIALSDFILRRLWYYTLTLGPSESPRFYVVIDEAHRLAYENSPLEPFLREARKYGVGVMLSSQRPTDFSESILANVSSIICLQCPLDKDARYMAQQLNCRPEEIKTLVRRGEALVKHTSSADPQRVQILPLFGRLA